jgi:MarR family transcriptional regulator, organic hydroperoxide resistance regulator
MTDTSSLTSEKQAVVDEQAERFITTFLGLRKVTGTGFKQWHQQGFSTTQFMILGLIGRSREENELYTISTLAAKMGLDPATVVRTVDSLEKRGLVERQRDKQDRRQVFIVFTESGQQHLIEAHQQIISRIRAVFQAMSAEGRTSLLNGLSEFIQVGQSIPAEQEREPEEQAAHS